MVFCVYKKIKNKINLTIYCFYLAYIFWSCISKLFHKKVNRSEKDHWCANNFLLINFHRFQHLAQNCSSVKF